MRSARGSARRGPWRVSRSQRVEASTGCLERLWGGIRRWLTARWSRPNQRTSGFGTVSTLGRPGGSVRGRKHHSSASVARLGAAFCQQAPGTDWRRITNFQEHIMAALRERFNRRERLKRFRFEENAPGYASGDTSGWRKEDNGSTAFTIAAQDRPSTVANCQNAVKWR